MRDFSFSDVSRRSGDILDAALVEPVALLKRGKPKIVMMPIEQYELLRQAARSAKPAEVWTLAEASPEELDRMLAALEAPSNPADTE